MSNEQALSAKVAMPQPSSPELQMLIMSVNALTANMNVLTATVTNHDTKLATQNDRIAKVERILDGEGEDVPGLRKRVLAIEKVIEGLARVQWLLGLLAALVGILGVGTVWQIAQHLLGH